MAKNIIKDEMWQTLRDRFEKGRNAYRPVADDAFLTLAFLAGHQHVCYSRTMGLVEVENESDEIRITDNRMLPAYQRWMGYMFQEKPVITCFEGGNELRDAERARVASSLCDFWEANCGWRKARENAAMWMSCSGVGYSAVSWRKNRKLEKKKGIAFVPDGVTDEHGTVSFTKETEQEEYPSDISFDPMNSLNVYPFPLAAKEWGKVTGVLVADIATLYWLQSNYDTALNPDDMQELSAAELNVSLLENIATRIGGELSGSVLDTGPEAKTYLVLQWYERPTRENKNGKYILAIGGKVLRNEELPYVEEARAVDPQDSFNITMGIFPLFPMQFPGRLVPPSPFGQLREPQVRLNDLLSDEVANRKSMGRNKLIYEKGTLEDDAWTGGTGEKIGLNAGSGMEPHFIQGMPLAGINQEIQRAETSFQEVSGQSEVLRGKNPAQVRSAFHLDILRQEALGLVNTVIDRVQDWYELQAKFALELARRRYTTDRIIAIHGLDYAGQALTFRSCNISTDIRVKTGSMQPRNKASKEAKLMELLQAGAFTDKKTGATNFDLFWQMSELGTLNRAIDHEQKHRLRARSENVMMIYGEPVIPLEHEPHDLHLEEHMGDMGRLEWYDAPMQIKALFLAHIQAHRDLVIAGVAPESMIPPDPVAGLGKFTSADPGIPPPPSGGMPSQQTMPTPQQMPTPQA
jgi:hypothetical protein